MIVSFSDYLPVERFDGNPWTQILLYESASDGEPWTLLETIDLSPLDTDPAHPQAREFTTNLATLVHGWYKIGWKDASGAIIETTPIQNVAGIAWRPTLQDVGSINMARTRDDVGNNIGTFSPKTQPTDDQVQPLIDKSVRDLLPDLGIDIPAALVQDAQDLAAIRTAMYIELSFFGTEIAQNRSPYSSYKELWVENLPKLVSAIAAIESGGDMTDSLEKGTSPAFGFPTPSTWLSREI